jgi:hypothetical protein
MNNILTHCTNTLKLSVLKFHKSIRTPLRAATCSRPLQPHADHPRNLGTPNAQVSLLYARGQPPALTRQALQCILTSTNSIYFTCCILEYPMKLFLRAQPVYSFPQTPRHDAKLSCRLPDPWSITLTPSGKDRADASCFA